VETGIHSSDRTFAVSWPIQPDILNPLLLRLTSRNLLDLQPAATNRVQIVSPRPQGPGWSGVAPDYITYLLPLVTNIPSPSSRRASSNGDLFQPRNERRTGDRAFSVAAARAWNRLSTTETRSVVNSNIQAPSEVLPFSHRVLTM